MKVHANSAAVLYRATPHGFRQLLADARATELKLNAAKGNRGPTASVSLARPIPGAKAMAQVPKTKPLSPSAQLAESRQLSHQHAQRLAAERADAMERRGEKLDARQIDLICKELLSGAANDAQAERAPGVPPPPHVEPLKPGPPFEGDVVRLAAARARAALERARRIELFLGANGPALELPLNDVLGARVHIERIGLNEVALVLKGDKGPPRAEAVGRIRESLRARGIKIGALTIG
jgi:hypothetical protein